MRKYIFFIVLLIPISYSVKAQEWKTLKKYKKDTGFEELQKGCWLKKDRKKGTNQWKEANRYNLEQESGNLKYETISARRDFYLWFDQELIRNGHEVEWPGYAAIVSDQFSKLDNELINLFVVRNKEVFAFVNEGSRNVFDYAFPYLKKIYFSKNPVIGVDAMEWDTNHGYIEQCKIVEVLYVNLSEKALKKISRMAKGKGIYSIGIPKEIRFIGNINDCECRLKHMELKIKPYYKNQLKKKL